MNICFQKVTLHNFLSFGDAEVDLNDSSYTLVSGINNCKLDLAKSNGSGKSSLWDSIIWVLTGDTIRGTKDVVNYYGCDGTYVTLEFSIDENNYEITRYKDYSNIGTNLKIIINGNDKSGKGIRDGEKILQEFLPDLNSSLLGSVIILGQGLPQRFSNNTPSGRKEVLEKLSKSDFMIEDIKYKLTKRKNDLTNNLRTLEDNNLALNTKKELYTKQLNDSLTKLNTIDAINYDQQINEKIVVLQSITQTKTQDEINLNILNTQLYLYEQTINELSQNHYDDFCKFIQPYQEQKDQHEKNYLGLKTKIDNLKLEIANLEKIVDICPSCGQKIPDVHKIDTSDRKERLHVLEDELIKFNDIRLNFINQMQQKENEFNKEYEDNITSYKNKCNELKKDIYEIKSHLDTNIEKIHNLELEIKELQLIRDTYEENILKLQESINRLKNDLNQIEEKLGYNNIDRDNMQTRLGLVNKMLNIATREFRGFLLSELINFINKKAKEYCKEVFETDIIEFKLEGNNINISYNKKAYENLSGGEKQKIDLIIQFSIRDMLTQYLDFSSNILVLDEIFDNLDSIGCQKILHLISNKLTDISSIFIITHHSDIDIPYDNKLNIVKDELGISKVI